MRDLGYLVGWDTSCKDAGGLVTFRLGWILIGRWSASLERKHCLVRLREGVVGVAGKMELANDWRTMRRGNNRSPMVARIWLCGRVLGKTVSELRLWVVLTVRVGASSRIHSLVFFLSFTRIVRPSWKPWRALSLPPASCTGWARAPWPTWPCASRTCSSRPFRPGVWVTSLGSDRRSVNGQVSQTQRHRLPSSRSGSRGSRPCLVCADKFPAQLLAFRSSSILLPETPAFRVSAWPLSHRGRA